MTRLHVIVPNYGLGSHGSRPDGIDLVQWDLNWMNSYIFWRISRKFLKFSTHPTTILRLTINTQLLLQPPNTSPTHNKINTFNSVTMDYIIQKSDNAVIEILKASSSSTSNNEQLINDDCPICREHIQALATIEPCGHIFDAECIEIVSNKTFCPPL